MEQEELKVIKLTLKELRKSVLEDEDIKTIFLSHYPELDFEENLDETLAQLEEYALDNDYDILQLSLEGIKLFFSSVLDEEIQDSEPDTSNYGKA
jgi:hypothetical protein